jgi:hypothetical protein
VNGLGTKLQHQVRFNQQLIEVSRCLVDRPQKAKARTRALKSKLGQPATEK